VEPKSISVKSEDARIALCLSLRLPSPCASCGCVETSCSGCTDPTGCSDCSSCCCTRSHSSWRQGRIRSALRLEYLTLGWVSIEALGSLGAGLVAGSLALMAFGGDSLIELISSLVVTRHLKADVNGLQTQGRRAAQFTSFLLLSLVPVVGIGAVYSFFNGLRPENSPFGIGVAVIAAVIMPFLWLSKKRIGAETRCLPLQIDGLESATCFLMSLTLLGGLLAESLLGLWWADYTATGVILAFVAREALESYRGVGDVLSNSVIMKAEQARPSL